MHHKTALGQCIQCMDTKHENWNAAQNVWSLPIRDCSGICRPLWNFKLKHPQVFGICM